MLPFVLFVGGQPSSGAVLAGRIGNSLFLSHTGFRCLIHIRSMRDRTCLARHPAELTVGSIRADSMVTVYLFYAKEVRGMPQGGVKRQGDAYCDGVQGDIRSH